MDDGGRRLSRGRGKRGLSTAFFLLSALLFAPSLITLPYPLVVGPTSFSTRVTLDEILPTLLIVIKCRPV